jgi:hypothetical protein
MSYMDGSRTLFDQCGGKILKFRRPPSEQQGKERPNATQHSLQQSNYQVPEIRPNPTNRNGQTLPQQMPAGLHCRAGLTGGNASATTRVIIQRSGLIARQSSLHCPIASYLSPTPDCPSACGKRNLAVTTAPLATAVVNKSNIKTARSQSRTSQSRTSQN